MKFRFGEQGQFFGVSCSGQSNGEFELLKIGFRGLAHGFGIVPHGIPAEKKKPLLVRIVERRERCCWEKGARLLQLGKLEFRKGGTFFIA